MTLDPHNISLAESSPQRQSQTSNLLWYHACAPIHHGQGRGKVVLGIPTAESKYILHDLKRPGIYYGLALIKDDTPTGLEIHSMVASLGWNPFFHDRQASFEVHLIGYNGDDFYGQTLSVLIMGYLRNEENYQSIDDLKEAIFRDIGAAKWRLQFDLRIERAHAYLLELAQRPHQ